MNPLIPAAIAMTQALTEKAERDAQAAQASALARARSVLYVVELCDGNQSEAARHLGLDPSTVNKLVQKTKNRDDDSPALLFARDHMGLTDSKPVFARDALANSDPHNALARTIWNGYQGVEYATITGHESATITGHASGQLKPIPHPDVED